MKSPLVLVTVLAAGVVAGCGGGTDEAAKQQAACKAAVEPYFTTLRDLDSRLSVGVTYLAYGEQLQEIAVANGNLRWDSAWSGNCLAAWTRGNDAFKAYKRAGEIWTACLKRRAPPYGRGECDPNHPRMKLLWVTAQKKIKSASDALDQIESSE